jgi:hypothetical protein
MISQIRPGIHHLGDQIIWVSSEMEKGRTNFDIQLTQGVYELFQGIVWEEKFARYQSFFELDFSCQLARFDESKFVECEIPTNPYITVQFDTSKDGDDSSNPEKKIYSLDEDWKIWIKNKYLSMGFELVDIGGKKWSLAETAYIIKHSQGHAGTVSAFGIFARCTGNKFIHLYYNSHMRETAELLPDICMNYIPFCNNNEIRLFFRDPNLRL